MRRSTLMSQVIDETIEKNRGAVKLFQTMTSPYDMRKLSKDHGLRMQVWQNQFHLIKLLDDDDVPDSPDDESMIDHTFYF